MSQILTSITSKGQVTIPVAVRKHLGVDTNDKLSFVIGPNGKVQITPAKYPNIASLRGAAGSLEKPLTLKQMRQTAYEGRKTNKYGKED